MSNVTLFRDQTSIVSSAQGLDDVTKSLLGNSGNYKRISLRGGKFRMIVNGQETARSPNGEMDVVVVNAAPKVSRTFYAKTFDPTAVGLPDCWSNDGERPDAKAPSPQGSTCESCPKNIAGSGTNGKGRACRFSRRLAVVLANNVENSDVYQLTLPATSIFGKAKGDDDMPLDAYVKHLAGYNYAITRVVTEMKFDQSAESPKLFFRAARSLNESEMAAVIEKGQSPEALAAISFNPAQMDLAKTAEATAPKASPFREEAPAKAEESAPAEPTVRKSKTDTAPVKSASVETLLDEWATDD